jgi:glutamate-1-semialdehyde 2,1-aminomutase
MKSEEIIRRSRDVIAGGVVSINRKVDPSLVFVRAQGSRIWDAEGKEYIDYHAAFAPHILGHNDPDVNAAVVRAMHEGWSLVGSGPTPWELRLAELLRECVPSMERVQLTSTGSEATALAIRLSRAYTGRQDIIVPLGGYNGWQDDVARTVMPPLDVVGPRVSPGEYRFVPMSEGMVSRRTHVVNFNDAESVEYVMRRYPIACVLTEPVLQNIGVVPPKPGYLQDLRRLCDRYGALLVFDEVKTGFRSALGGYQSMCGVRPDLSVFGKAVANGYPLGVIGGRRDVMDLFDGRVLIAGTYNGHPAAVAAALATIEKLKRGVYGTLEKLGARLQAGLSKLGTVSRIGSAFGLYFMDQVPLDWHDVAASHDFDRDRSFRRRLIDRGIYFFPVPCKQGSISAAHREAEIDQTIRSASQ